MSGQYLLDETSAASPTSIDVAPTPCSPPLQGTAGNLNLSPLTSSNKLSTFDGCFVPVPPFNFLKRTQPYTLCEVFFSIFGVVLYTRMGWIVGSAGLSGFSIILVIGEVPTSIAVG
jgi:hypothetical protein